MIETHTGAVQLIRLAFGIAVADRAARAVVVDPAIGADDNGCFSRATMAMALNLKLFDDLRQRSAVAAAYVGDVVAAGHRVVFDHGALRTILFADGPTGSLPPGERAFRRILEPLGYREVGLYPLPALMMTGWAYAHRDFPETIPQFFVSELHVDRFSLAFAEGAHAVFDSSVDPLDAATKACLDKLAAGERIDRATAAAALPVLAGAFDRQHRRPMLTAYETLLAESAEAAWIATEGNAFNHATDRVDDVEALAAGQRALGRTMKDKVERSANGRVRQTAFRADHVERRFGVPDGEDVTRVVPGSFYEFITRELDPQSEAIDLTFDSGNATGIFHMTRGEAVPVAQNG